MSKYRVVCGEHNLRRTDKYEVTMQVTDIKMHPDYWSASKSGRDMAIYKVSGHNCVLRWVSKRCDVVKTGD